jgi:uroporphyrinogen-III synthase
VRHVADELPRRAGIVRAGGHELRVLGACVVVDGTPKALSPAGMAVLKTLARRPGQVVSREDLLAALPGGGGDTHAVETAMARVRSALGAPRAIQTVVKRGYRLAVDDSADDLIDAVSSVPGGGLGRTGEAS